MRRLAADRFCLPCEKRFIREGYIGVCDHDFPGRPARWWWCNLRPPIFGGGGGLINVGVVRSSTISRARELLAPPQRHPVMPLDDPAVLAMAEGLDVDAPFIIPDIPAPTPWHDRRWSPYRS